VFGGFLLLSKLPVKIDILQDCSTSGKYLLDGDNIFVEVLFSLSKKQLAPSLGLLVLIFPRIGKYDRSFFIENLADRLA
jgi:hypothetical protein